MVKKLTVELWFNNTVVNEDEVKMTIERGIDKVGYCPTEIYWETIKCTNCECTEEVIRLDVKGDYYIICTECGQIKASDNCVLVPGGDTVELIELV